MRGRPCLSQILGQADSFGAKSPIFSRYSLVAPQRQHLSKTLALCLKNVCYRVSLSENRQRQTCKAFIGLSMCAKMIGGDVPNYVKIWRIPTHRLAKRRFSIYTVSTKNGPPFYFSNNSVKN